MTEPTDNAAQAADAVTAQADSQAAGVSLPDTGAGDVAQDPNGTAVPLKTAQDGDQTASQEQNPAALPAAPPPEPEVTEEPAPERRAPTIEEMRADVPDNRFEAVLLDTIIDLQKRLTTLEAKAKHFF